jgi:hypothetical protein
LSLPRAWARAARLLVLLALGAATLAAASLASSFTAACGTTVDLGGTPDSGLPDTGAEELLNLCEPCASAASCPVGATCAHISGAYLFCATVCPRGTECDADDTCQLVPSSVAGETIRACIPNGGVCNPPAPPTVDGAPLEHCGALDGPAIVAPCKSCDRADRDCQPNGCYGGWWCNTKTNRCHKPPAICP